MAVSAVNPAWAGHTYDNKLGMLHRFTVKIGKYDLGGWQKVSGLAVEFTTEQVTQAGFNTYTVQLLKQPKWTDIELERAIVDDSGEWRLTYQYLAEALHNPQMSDSPSMDLTIQVNSAWGDPVRTLQFLRARPRKWVGPTLLASSTTNVATEKLTFVHEGFFPNGSLL